MEEMQAVIINLNQKNFLRQQILIKNLTISLPVVAQKEGSFKLTMGQFC